MTQEKNSNLSTLRLITYIMISIIVFAIGFYLIESTGLDQKITLKLYQPNQKVYVLLVLFAEIGKYLPPFLILSFFLYSIKKAQYRRESIYLMSVLVFATALLINAVLKPTFTRPRPEYCQEFNPQAELQFIHAFGATEIIDSSSFPSGHTGSAFSLLAIFFVLLKRNSPKRHLALALLCLFGFSVGATRIIQGRHFLSDILGSFASLWLSCLVLYPTLTQKTKANSALTKSSY